MGPMPRTLNDPWRLAHLEVPNRVVLAPLAGIGNWFVRLQAKRYGAGMVVSEMVSSFGVHHGNEKTTTEMLRIEPAERAGSGLPVTVKIRSGRRVGDRSGFHLAHRLVDEAGVAAIGFHPRSAQVHHKGSPDLELARELTETLRAPVILSGGMDDPESILHAFEYTGCEAVMLARGVLGNPWLFARLLGTRDDEPTTAEVLAELEWVMQRAVEHMGERRAGRYLRKFYPWYVERIGGLKALQAAPPATDTVAQARAVLAGVENVSVAA